MSINSLSLNRFTPPQQARLNSKAAQQREGSELPPELLTALAKYNANATDEGVAFVSGLVKDWETNGDPNTLQRIRTVVDAALEPIENYINRILGPGGTPLGLTIN